MESQRPPRSEARVRTDRQGAREGRRLRLQRDADRGRGDQHNADDGKELPGGDDNDVGVTGRRGRDRCRQDAARIANSHALRLRTPSIGLVELPLTDRGGALHRAGG